MHKTLCLMLCLTLGVGAMKAQVTIGSEHAPTQGSLLDLKEYNDDEAKSGGRTSKKGLGLPRVAISDIATVDLAESLAQTSGTLDSEAHVGLVIYNTITKQGGAIADHSELICPGVHVWVGNKWSPLVAYPATGLFCVPSENIPDGVISVSPEALHFASSQDFRGNPTSQNLTLSWSPTSAIVGVAESNVVIDGTTLPRLNFSSSVPSTITSSPLTLLPTNMTKAEVDANLFATKAVKLTFSIVDEKGATKTAEVDVRQTNKALTIDGARGWVYSTVPKVRIDQEYDGVKGTVTTGNSLTIKTNSDWELTILPRGRSAITPSTLSVSMERDDNDAGTHVLNYDIISDYELSTNNYLLFTDKSDLKRFKTEVVPIVQYASPFGANGRDIAHPITDLTMAEYAELWELMYGVDPDNLEPDSDGDITKNINRVRWHYARPDLPANDSKQSIYFSSQFGAIRWMVTNLDLTHFTPRTETPEVEWSAAPTLEYKTASLPDNGYYWTYSRTDVYDDPLSDVDAYYKAKERNGMAYNYNAIVAGEAVKYVEGSNINLAKDYQGICPAGWHVPSNSEWVLLANHLLLNPSQHSTIATIEDPNPIDIEGGASPYTTVYDVGNVMIGNSEHSKISRNDPPGKSFHFIYGGFDAPLIGYPSAADEGNSYYGRYSYYGTAYPQQGNYQIRFINPVLPDNYMSYQGLEKKETMMPIRCIKD